MDKEFVDQQIEAHQRKELERESKEFKLYRLRKELAEWADDISHSWDDYKREWDQDEKTIAIEKYDKLLAEYIILLDEYEELKHEA